MPVQKPGQKKAARKPAQQAAWKNRLASMQGAYEEAGALQNEFDDKPDGVYIAKLTAAEIRESESAGNLGILLTYQIVEGEFEGQKITSWEGLNEEKPQQMAFVRKKLALQGCEVPDDITELPAALEAMVAQGPTVRMKLQDHDGYQRKSVLKVVSWDGADGVDPEEEPKPRKAAGKKPAGKGKAAAEPEEDPEEAGEPEEEAPKPRGKAASKPAGKPRSTKREEPEEDPEEDLEGAEDVELDGEELADDPEEAGEPEEELVALEVGSKVRVLKPDGETLVGTGKVKSINEDDSTAAIVMDKGGKTYRISFDRLQVVD